MKLEIGFNQLFEVRHEHYKASSERFTILFISDLHFNRFTKSLAGRVIKAVNEWNPDILLLGGDYCDGRGASVHLQTLLAGISGRKNVFGISGNHDVLFGEPKIISLFRQHQVPWIEKQSVQCSVGNITVQIDGSQPAVRKPDSDFSVLCLHQPKSIGRYADEYDMVFAGHLHGGQFVLWQKGEALYPGRYFFRWNVLKEKVGNCWYYISKGIGDTFPLRWNCKREILLVSVGNDACINPLKTIG